MAGLGENEMVPKLAMPWSVRLTKGLGITVAGGAEPAEDETGLHLVPVRWFGKYREPKFTDKTEREARPALAAGRARSDARGPDAWLFGLCPFRMSAIVSVAREQRQVIPRGAAICSERRQGVAEA